MSKPEVEFDLTGCEKMIKALDKMSVDVEPAVSKAAQAGLKPVKRAVKAETPVAKEGGGTLKKAIGQKKEKTVYPAKRVYEVRVSPKYNDVLQKEIKKPGIYGGKSTKGYVPASMEYGFLVRRKDGSGLEYRYGRQFKNYTNDLADWYSKHGGDRQRSLIQTRAGRKRNSYVEIVQGVESRKVEGRHFMRQGAEQSEAQSKQIMIDTMEKELDKLWQEAQHE